MPHFLPFRGVRYDVARVDLALSTSPPYDVLDAEDRAALAAAHRANAVVIDLPVDGADPYVEAGETLRRWLAEGILVQDEAPAFYVYRMEWRDETGHYRATTGVFGALELSRPGEGGILPHEHTTPKAKSDRLNLLRGAQANLSAVWGLSPSAGLSKLLDMDEPPLAHWASDDGVAHSLWTITEPDRLAAITDAVSSNPVVIADGHHRYETSLAYRDEQREAGAGPDAPSEATLVYIVELVDDELNVMPIHRLLRGLPERFDLLAALSTSFVATPADIDGDIAERMAAQGALALVTPGGAWFLEPRPEVVAAARDLDSSRLDVALATLPAHELTFQHGVDQVRTKVATGEAQAGILLRPASVAQIVEIAHGGERMPPKTTFFYPKPRTGVVYRLL